MRLSKLALAGAVAGLLSAGNAYAQQPWGQPSTVRQTAFEYDLYNSYYAQSDAQPAAPPAAAPVDGMIMPGACDTCAAPCGYDSCCGGLLNPCCCLGEQWKLFNSECLECRGINIAGYIVQSYTWNTTNPADRFNGPVTMTDRSNEYQLNQVYLWAEKATDTGGCGWDFGWRADWVGGTDYRFVTAAGLETRGFFVDPKVSSQRFYGYAFPQFYVEGAYNDLKVKVGHFYAPVGYEVYQIAYDFFPNLPYTFQYGEPFTLTGILGTWQWSESVAIGAGIHHGWDNFDNTYNPHGGFVGTFSEKFADDATLAFAWTVGNEPNLGGTFSNRFLQTAVYSRPLVNINENLTWIIQSDLGYQNDMLANGEDAYWYGINQYLFYKVSDCMSYGIRAEWFRDQEGSRVGGFLGTTDSGSTRGLDTARFGYAGSFYEVTIGANWKYNANWTVRPYVRFDWFSGVSPSPALRPFDGGNGNSQTLIGLDVVTWF